MRIDGGCHCGYLTYEADADPEIIDRLRTVFELDAWQVFPVNPVRTKSLLGCTKYSTLEVAATANYTFEIYTSQGCGARIRGSTTMCTQKGTILNYQSRDALTGLISYYRRLGC